MLKIIRITDQNLDLLEKFCVEAAQAGYQNNSNLAAMKYGNTSDLPSPALFWGIIFKEKLISISGCHLIENNDLRCLFRGASLPEYNIIKIGRAHV